MKKLFQTSLQNRKFLYNILKNTPIERLQLIPDGYRNNIWWNIAHVLVTQQLLVYDRSNLPMSIPNHLVQKFRKGTVPALQLTQEDIDEVAAYLFSTIEGTEDDYDKKIFVEYKEFTTATKTLISSVEDALVFNLFHEGLHLGIILSLQKAIMITSNS